MKKITTLLIITLSLLISCSPNLNPKTFAIRKIFYLSEVIAKKKSFYKEEFLLQIDNRRVKLSSVDYNLDIQMNYFYAYKQGIGYDQNNKEWDIEVYNFQKSPYFITLVSDSVQITIGNQYTN